MPVPALVLDPEATATFPELEPPAWASGASSARGPRGGAFPDIDEVAEKLENQNRMDHAERIGRGDDTEFSPEITRDKFDCREHPMVAGITCKYLGWR